MALELARRVQDLPRELRDMVYSNLWDDKIMQKLDYSSRLLPTGGSKRLNSTGIPTFAQPRFVGHNFAHEAVLWLYNNYRGFMVSNSADISLFLAVDVFQLGLSPYRARLRCLSLEINLFAPYRRPRSLSRTQDDFATLADLTKVKTHRDFHLIITLKAKRPPVLSERIFHHPLPYPGMNLVSQALVDLYLSVKELEQSNRRVSIVMNHFRYGVVDVKHLLGSVNEARWCERGVAYDSRERESCWCDFLGNKRAAVLSQSGFSAEQIEYMVAIDGVLLHHELTFPEHPDA
jgi:hypothetical protein